MDNRFSTFLFELDLLIRKLEIDKLVGLDADYIIEMFEVELLDWINR